MGRFTVRIPDTLHHELETQAQQEGVSLNQYMVYVLAQKTKPTYTIQVVPNEDIQQQATRFESLLKRLGEPNRSEAKEFLASREVVQPEDQQTADFIAKVEAKIAALESS